MLNSLPDLEHLFILFQTAVNYKRNRHEPGELSPETEANGSMKKKKSSTKGSTDGFCRPAPGPGR